MNYFTIKSSIFLVLSSECDEEFRKIDKFLKILNKSCIGTIIEKEKNRDHIFQKGRKGYNLDLKTEKIPFPKQKKEKGC